MVYLTVEVTLIRFVNINRHFVNCTRFIKMHSCEVKIILYYPKIHHQVWSNCNNHWCSWQYKHKLSESKMSAVAIILNFLGLTFLWTNKICWGILWDDIFEMTMACLTPRFIHYSFTGGIHEQFVCTVTATLIFRSWKIHLVSCHIARIGI